MLCGVWRAIVVWSVEDLCCVECEGWRTNVVWSVDDYCSMECEGIMDCGLRRSILV